MISFRGAVEARDLDAMAALLAEDVTFRSPVAHAPYEGKAITLAILANVVEVFEDFRYVRDIADGPDHVLVFEARVGEMQLTGCDLLRYDADGLITELMVMVRPLRAAGALAEAMGARWEQIAAMAAES